MKSLEIVSYSLSKGRHNQQRNVPLDCDSRLSTTSEQNRRRHESRDSKSRCVSNVLLHVFTIDDATYGAHNDAIRHRRLLTTTPADASVIAGYRSNGSSRQVRFRFRPEESPEFISKPSTVDDATDAAKHVSINGVVSTATVVKYEEDSPAASGNGQVYQTPRSRRKQQGWSTLVPHRRAVPDSLEGQSCLQYLDTRGCQLKETQAASRLGRRAHTAPLRRQADLNRALRQLTLERAEQRQRARTAHCR